MLLFVALRALDCLLSPMGLADRPLLALVVTLLVVDASDAAGGRLDDRFI